MHVTIIIWLLMIDDFSCILDNNEEIAAFGDCSQAVSVLGCDFIYNGIPVNEICPVSCDCEINQDFGCTDENACNYNELAIINDGSCQYIDDCGICGGDNTLCLGCLDQAACNYNPYAFIDDGSCTYSEEDYDCEGNYNCTGILITNDGGQFQSEVEWSIQDCDGNMIIEGGAPYIDCIEELPDAYIINMSDYFGDGWNGNLLTVGDVSYQGPSSSLGSGEVVSQMVGSCGGGGCTNTLALNYDLDAIYDDATCEFDCLFIECDGGDYQQEVDGKFKIV